MIDINNHYERLVLTNLGAIVSNKTEIVAPMSKEKLIIERVVSDKYPPNELNEYAASKYREFNLIIQKELNKLRDLGSAITDEVVRLDESSYISQSDAEENPIVSKLCFDWFKQKKNILETYEKRNLKFQLQTNYNETILMTNDLKNICVNAALIQIQRNALDRVNKIELDLIQKKILELVGFRYEINIDEYSKINLKIHKFMKV